MKNDLDFHSRNEPLRVLNRKTEKSRVEFSRGKFLRKGLVRPKKKKKMEMRKRVMNDSIVRQTKETSRIRLNSNTYSKKQDNE